MHLSVYLYMCVRNAFAKCRCDWRWSWQCLRVVSAAFRLLSTWTELNWAAQVNRGWMWMWMSWTCRRIFYACMTYRDRFTLNFNNRCMSLAFANTARWRWNAGITFDSEWAFTFAVFPLNVCCSASLKWLHTQEPQPSSTFFSIQSVCTFDSTHPALLI